MRVDRGVAPQLARLDAVATIAAAKFDADRNFEPFGAQTAAQWIATACHLPKGTARHLVALGRKLRHLPKCEEAWLAGDLSGSHVAVIASKRRDATADLLSRDESLLVDNAKSMRFELFVKTVDYWDQRAHPDGAEEQDRDRQDRRDVAAPMPSSRWRSGLRRPADGIRPVPLFTVYVGYETMHGPICELAGGTVLSPGALLPWLDQAYLERAVFRSPRRVEIGTRERLFRGATRRAVIVRDRECTHEFCDKSADQCEIEHVIPYARGGPTTQENGDLRFGFHNRLKEKRPPDTRAPVARAAPATRAAPAAAGAAPPAAPVP